MLNRAAVNAMLVGLSPNDELIRILQLRGEGLISREECLRRLPFEVEGIANLQLDGLE